MNNSNSYVALSEAEVCQGGVGGLTLRWWLNSPKIKSYNFPGGWWGACPHSPPVNDSKYILLILLKN